MEHFITYKELAGYIKEYEEEFGFKTLDELYRYLKENEDIRITITRGWRGQLSPLFLF